MGLPAPRLTLDGSRGLLCVPRRLMLGGGAGGDGRGVIERKGGQILSNPYTKVKERRIWVENGLFRHSSV